MYCKIEEDLYNRIREITGVDYDKEGDFISESTLFDILKDLICEIDTLKERLGE